MPNEKCNNETRLINFHRLFIFLTVENFPVYSTWTNSMIWYQTCIAPSTENVTKENFHKYYFYNDHEITKIFYYKIWSHTISYNKCSCNNSISDWENKKTQSLVDRYSHDVMLAHNDTLTVMWSQQGNTSMGWTHYIQHSQYLYIFLLWFVSG